MLHCAEWTGNLAVLPCWLQPPGAGFRYTGIGQVWFPDTMHLDDGLLREMLKDIRQTLTKPAKRNVQRSLDVAWQKPARPCLVPKGGVDSIGDRLVAVKVVALAKALVVALAEELPQAALTLAGVLSLA